MMMLATTGHFVANCGNLTFKRVLLVLLKVLGHMEMIQTFGMGNGLILQQETCTTDQNAQIGYDLKAEVPEFVTDSYPYSTSEVSILPTSRSRVAPVRGAHISEPVIP
ncbi:hypothetical protein M6B38_260755 [Iris pallida]|uniref:Uncharacterized protein n=1 Tax=Iris pallida TaxID=29817 RepID=A0AAX6IDJ9_IRIPA|nr:hypothetical protein M6B38_177860 [Iris pallida]KAJ6851148.1 hypothetical protein M6B38_260755 [Iris pallida]